MPDASVEPIGTGTCATCGNAIIGGKGDWWHTAPGGGYGDMHGPDGHLATPKRVPVDNATTIRAVELRIGVLRREIATLQANLAADEEWLSDLNRH